MSGEISKALREAITGIMEVALPDETVWHAFGYELNAALQMVANAAMTHEDLAFRAGCETAAVVLSLMLRDAYPDPEQRTTIVKEWQDRFNGTLALLIEPETPHA